MMLAAIDSNLLFYVIAAVIGLISWLTKKDEKGSGEHTPTPPFPRPKPTGQGQQKPEADRMREFLDALGIPADQRPPVAKPRTPPAAPRAAVAEDLRGKAAPASRSADAPAPWVTPPTRTPSPPPPLPRSVVIGRERPPVASPRAPVSPPERDEWAGLDEQAAPTLSVEQLHLPELVTSRVPELVTTSSAISAIPSEHKSVMPSPSDAYDRDAGLGGDHARTRVKALLQSAPDLRAAIILREVLGPAPGLPRSRSLPTFP